MDRRAMVGLLLGVATGGCLRQTEDDVNGETPAEPVDPGRTERTTAPPTETTAEPVENALELRQVWDAPTHFADLVATADGFLLTATADGVLAGLGGDGSIQWGSEAGQEAGWPAVPSGIAAADRRVYAGLAAESDSGSGGQLVAFDRDTGEEVWSYRAPDDGNHFRVEPVVTGGGTVFCASQSGGSGDEQAPRVYGFDAATGAQDWVEELEDGFVTGLVRYEDRLYVQSVFRLLVYSLDPVEVVDERNWSLGFQRMVRDGEVLYMPGDAVTAFNLATERVDWRTDLFEKATTPPALSEGAVYVGTEAGFVTGFDRTSGERLWERHLEAAVEHRLAVYDGVVFAGDESGRLWGLDGSSGDVLYREAVDDDGFSFDVFDGVLLDDVRRTGFEIYRP